MTTWARLQAVLVAALALWVCGALAGPAPAWGYACVASPCTGWCPAAVPYRLNEPSEDLGLELSESEVIRSMEAWSTPSCSGLKTQYGGRTDEEPSDTNGVVAWVASGWSGGSGTIGTTTMRISRNCLTAHMRLNGVNFNWVVGEPKRGEVNTFSIVAHEFGHYLGLGHSNAAGAIMRASYPGGVLTITEDDATGICKLYPGGGGGAEPPTDCRQAGCSDGLTCIDGVCRESSPADAAAPADAAGSGGTPSVDAAPVITSDAAPATPRPARDAGGGGGVGVDAARGGGTSVPGDDGSPCDTDDDCRSTLCLELGGTPVCSRLCTRNGDCARGFACQTTRHESVCVPLAVNLTPGDPASMAVDRQPVSGGCAVGPRGGELAPGGPLLALGLLLSRLRRRR